VTSYAIIESMTEPVGRRAASKRATRAAIFSAAQRLFAERGFEATTVRDIAATANVTERTFYRYFDGKESLLAGEFESWLEMLRAAIETRPPAEPPFVAVHRAMLSIGPEAANGPTPGPPLWIFGDGGSLRVLRRTGPRPLLRLEASIRDSILARIGAGETDPDQRFSAEVISRVAVGAVRSAIIRHRELRAAGDAGGPSLEQLLGQAFTVIREQASGYEADDC
jgi:AcrR family transcriptional regulator